MRCFSQNYVALNKQAVYLGEFDAPLTLEKQLDYSKSKLATGSTIVSITISPSTNCT